MLLSVGAKYPFDIFDICQKFENLKIGACPFKTVGLRGMAILADKTSPINCILVNSNLSSEEQNFHGAHELIHIFTSDPNSGQTFKCYDKVQPFQNSYIEWIANEGAAELILSYKELLPFIKDNLPSFNSDTLPIFGIVEKISQNYNVSQTVVQNRLGNLKYEIYQYLNGTDIENIEILSNRQQQNLGIYVDSLADIEAKRIVDCLKNHKSAINQPFFEYSNSYKNCKIIASL